MKSRILTGQRSFADEFARCCSDHETLSLATAWCGDPARIFPFQYLKRLRGKISATIGVSFNETHPDAITALQREGSDVRIYRDGLGLFHPKVYLFQTGQKFALFIGSSNFTPPGFYTNQEVNVFLSGDLKDDGASEVSAMARCLAEWHSAKCSFVADKSWLERYRIAYFETRAKVRRAGIPTAVDTAAALPGSWLATAQWDEFYPEVLSRLRLHGRTTEGYHAVIDAAAANLPLPWTTTHFETLEQRRIIGGIGEYGWLGHVAASGRFRALMANGKAARLRTVVNAVNDASELVSPVDWRRLANVLARLVGLGFTMKTWGRLLTLARPDLYCTVSAGSVRENLAGLLDLPKSHFERPEGYIRMLQLVHDSPWYRSERPTRPDERAVWDRRVAFIDPIYYEGRNPT